MSLTVTTLGRDPGEDLFYTEKFRTIVETHLGILKTIGITERDIPGDLAYQFEGDFYGYLAHLGIPLHLHWVYLRVNGFVHPNEFASEGRDPYRRSFNLRLLIPSSELISNLRALYLTTKFKS
jgi:hypothetical protein